MNKLDLSTLGVEEMSDAQMMEVDGGWFMTFVDWYIDFAKDYIAFGKNNSDIVEVGANCM
jgi:hypothetical protein